MDQSRHLGDPLSIRINVPRVPVLARTWGLIFFTALSLAPRRECFVPFDTFTALLLVAEKLASLRRLLDLWPHRQYGTGRLGYDVVRRAHVQVRGGKYASSVPYSHHN